MVVEARVSRLSLAPSSPVIGEFYSLHRSGSQVSADNPRQDRAIERDRTLAPRVPRAQTASSRGSSVPPLLSGMRRSRDRYYSDLRYREHRGAIYRSARSTRSRVAADSRYRIPRTRARREGSGGGGGRQRRDNHSPRQPRTRPSDMLHREASDCSTPLYSSRQIIIT